MMLFSFYLLFINIFEFKKFLHFLNLLQFNYYDLKFSIKKISTKNIKYKLQFYNLIIVIFSILHIFLKNSFTFNLLFYLIILLLILTVSFKDFEHKNLKITSRIKVLLIIYITLNCFLIYISYRLQQQWRFIFYFLLLKFIQYLSFCLNKLYIDLLTIISIKKEVKRIKLSCNPVILSITGSFGKTSCKNIIHDILSVKYNVFQTIKNYNTPIGILKSLKKFDSGAFLILEFGARKKGEIKKLCNFFKPNLGVVVSCEKQHLESFKTIKNIYHTKKELADFIEKIKGTMIFNLDNKYTENMFKNYNGIKYGVSINYKHLKSFKSYDNIVFAKNITVTDFGSVFDVYLGEAFVGNFSTKLLGEHNIINILIGITFGLIYGLNQIELRIGVSKIKQIPHRLELKKLNNGAMLLDDSYNSNIHSFECALKVLEIFKDKIKIIVTPGIVELGDEQYKNNKHLGKLMSQVADFVIIEKNVNFEALSQGLLSENFDVNKLYKIKRINDEFFQLLNNLNKNYIILIENNLPEFYR